MSGVEGFDEVPDFQAARAVVQACDPLTMARFPDLEDRIRYAFVHVTHGFMRDWWGSQSPGMTLRVSAETGADALWCEWLVAAAMHAVLITGLPADVKTVEDLAVQAAMVDKQLNRRTRA